MSIFKLCGAPGARRALAGVVLAAAVLSHPVMAQEEGADEAPREAEVGSEVELLEVTGKQRDAALAVDLEQYGNKVQIVDAEQIEAGGYTNIAEAVQGLVKGANIGYSPDEGEYTLRLDGGSDRDTLVLLDGIPLFDRGPALETIWGATIVDVHMIERIEVYRGGQSLYFGSNGGVGVINLITKQPDGTTKGEIGVSYGDFNTRDLWANHSFPLGESGKHSLMVYGSNKSSDGPELFEPEVYVDNIARAGAIHEYPLNRNNLGVKYLWDIDASSELRLGAQYAQIEFRDAFPHTTIYAPNTTEYPMVDMRYRKRWSETFQTEVEAYYTNPVLHNTELFPVVCENPDGCPDANDPDRTVPYGVWTGEAQPYNNQGFDQRKGGYEELTASVRNRIFFGSSLEMVLGLQSVNYRNDSDEVFGIDDDIESVNGVYLDLRPRLPFSPSTTLSLAVRTDFADSFGSKTIYKAGFRQPVGGGFYLRANGGTSYSLPRTNELFRNTEDLVGNPDLETVETESYNFGFGLKRQLAGRPFSAEIGGFVTDIDNRIDTTDNQMPDTYFNAEGTTEIRGVTADIEYRITERWSGSLSYTGIDATEEGSDLQLDQQPEWFVVGNLRYSSAEDRYHFTLLPRLQGPEFASSGDRVRFDYGDYFLLNASLGYWAGDSRQHRFQLRMVNVLDEDYAERGGVGDQRYGEAFIRGEISRDDPAYLFPYEFKGKSRSFFVSYSYRY